MVKREKPGPRATQDRRVAQLLDLQDELGLTDMQRVFVEALAVDPQRNATKAAIAAGSAKKGATVQASKWLRLVVPIGLAPTHTTCRRSSGRGPSPVPAASGRPPSAYGVC